MKKRFLILLNVALFLFPVTGSCLEINKIAFGLNGGVFLPRGDLKDEDIFFLDTGYTLGAEAMLPLPKFDNNF